MSVYEKLVAIQSELKAPKDQFNAFGKYKYRSCEDIVEAVKPLLAKHKCVLTMADDIEVKGERFYVCAAATLVDAESGECVVTTAYAREDKEKKGMDGSQITGTASSYARKYALNGLFAIDDTKDADATNTHGKDEKKPVQYVCADCGKTIEGYGKVSAERHVNRSLEMFGQTLCLECIQKRQAANAQGIADRAAEMGVAVNRS